MIDEEFSRVDGGTWRIGVLYIMCWQFHVASLRASALMWQISPKMPF